MGSMNFGIFHVTEKIEKWQHEWEKAYVEKTKDLIVSNTFAQIERFIRELGHGCGTRFECECYDVGHLYTLAHFLDRKLLEPPIFVQTIFGVLGGIGPHPEDLMHMRRTADRLFGGDYQWSILAAGRHQISLATIGATMGGNVRVGSGRQHLSWPRAAGEEQCRAGHQDPQHPDRAFPRRGDAGRSPRHAEAEGRRQGRLLTMARAIETYRGVAYPWHCDSMGHMNTQFYSALYDGASFHFLSMLAPYNELQKAGMGWADVRQLIEYKHEVPAGSLLLVRTTLKRVGNKSVEYLHELRNAKPTSFIPPASR